MTRIAIMRPEEKMNESISLAKSMGFDPICASPLRVDIVDSHDFDEFLDLAINGMLDAIVLTSSIGVRALIQLAERRMRKVDFLALVRRMQVLSIGPQTARSLEGMGVRVDFMPETYSSEGILASLPKRWGAGKRIVVIRSDRGEQKLIGGLRKEGAEVSEVIVYCLVQVQDDPEVKALVAKGLAGEIDTFAFTSPLSAKTFLEAAEGLTSKQAVLDMLGRSIVAAIGKPTKEALEGGGVRVDVVPESAIFEHLLLAIKSVIDKRRRTR